LKRECGAAQTSGDDQKNFPSAGLVTWELWVSAKTAAALSWSAKYLRRIREVVRPRD
jgi:hypothetical protein